MLICQKCLEETYEEKFKKNKSFAEKCNICKGIYMCEEIDQTKLTPKGDEPEEMIYSEFVKRYMIPKKQWDFNLFKITCNKCGSNKVEFNGKINLGWGNVYYPEDTPNIEGKIIIKCHECGNAHTIDKYQLE